MTREDIQAVHQKYAAAARRALDAGFEWLEIHYAHGFLGASFMSPIYADEIIRTDQIDLLMVGRPTLANPHWPLYAALVLGKETAYEILPDQYSYFLNKAKGISHVNGFGPIPARTPA